MTHPKAPGIAVGITEPMIRNLVETFYAKVRDDAELGPIFAARVADWGAHFDSCWTSGHRLPS